MMRRGGEGDNLGVRARRLILLGSAAALLAGCGGGDSQKAAEVFSRPMDCSRVQQTTLRTTECVHRPLVRSISRRTAEKRRAVPKVQCKTRFVATFYAANDW